MSQEYQKTATGATEAEAKKALKDLLPHAPGSKEYKTYKAGVAHVEEVGSYVAVAKYTLREGKDQSGKGEGCAPSALERMMN